MVAPLRAINRARNVNKTLFWIQCATCWPIYVLDQNFVSSPYSLQYEENDEVEDTDVNVVNDNHHDLVVDNIEAVTYFAEG